MNPWIPIGRVVLVCIVFYFGLYGVIFLLAFLESFMEHLRWNKCYRKTRNTEPAIGQLWKSKNEDCYHITNQITGHNSLRIWINNIGDFMSPQEFKQLVHKKKLVLVCT